MISEPVKNPKLGTRIRRPMTVASVSVHVWSYYRLELQGLWQIALSTGGLVAVVDYATNIAKYTLSYGCLANSDNNSDNN
jgi:hypothetical protein